MDKSKIMKRLSVYHICSCNTSIKTDIHRWLNNEGHKHCKMLRTYLPQKRHYYSIIRLSKNSIYYIMADNIGFNLYDLTSGKLLYHYYEFNTSVKEVELIALKYIENIEFT